MRGFFSLIFQNTFFRNSAILFIGTMIGNVLNYIFHLVTGRIVEPSVYGEIESLISLLAIISVPAGTLILIATKYAAKMKAENNVAGVRLLARYLNKKILIYGVPLFFLVLLFTPFIKQFLNIKETLPIFFIWLVMLFSFLGAVASGILSGWQKFVHSSIAGVLSAILKLGAAIFFLGLGFGASGVIGSYALASVFGFIIMWYFIARFFPANPVLQNQNISLPFASLKSYVAPAFYGTLSLAILGNVDMIFAKHHLEATVSGEYGALSIVAKTIFFATGVLTTVLFAMSAEENSRAGNSSRTFKLAAWSTALASGIAIILFSSFPSFFMALLFGEKYLAVSSYLGWFALIAGVYSIANLFLQYLLSLHETRVMIVFLALAGLEILVLNFWGSTFYDIIAITLVTQVLAAILGFYYIVKKKPHVQEDFYSNSSL